MEFPNEELTAKNYKELQHRKLRNKELVVDFVGEKSSYIKKEEKKKQQKEAQREPDSKRIHIGGLDKKTTEADLKKLFTNFTEFSMPTKKDTKLNMGFAFVTFANEDDAKKALEKTNGKEVNGRKITVEFAFKRVEQTNNKKENKKEVAKKATEEQQPAAKKRKNEKVK